MPLSEIPLERLNRQLEDPYCTSDVEPNDTTAPISEMLLLNMQQEDPYFISDAELDDVCSISGIHQLEVTLEWEFEAEPDQGETSEDSEDGEKVP